MGMNELQEVRWCCAPNKASTLEIYHLENLTIQLGRASLILFCSCLSILLSINPNSFNFLRSPILSGSFVTLQPSRDKYSKLEIFSILSTDVRATLSDRSSVFKSFNSANSTGILWIPFTFRIRVVSFFRFLICGG